MNKKDATAIAISINPALAVNDVLLNNLLELSKGTINGLPAYRPFIVAARSLSMLPPQGDLKKADDVEWFDWQRRADDLMLNQIADDVGIDNIPVGWIAMSSDFTPAAAIISDSRYL